MGPFPAEMWPEGQGVVPWRLKKWRRELMEKFPVGPMKSPYRSRKSHTVSSIFMTLCVLAACWRVQRSSVICTLGRAVSPCPPCARPRRSFRPVLS